MVRVRLRAAGARRGKLTSDPAVEAAAVAINLGLPPLWYLALSPGDHDIVTAAMNQAQKQRSDRDYDLADYQATKTAGQVAQIVARMFRR